MAAIARGGAIAVAADALVNVIRLRLLVRRGGVAVDACEAGVVGGHLMAVVADRTMVRDREIRVIEGRAQPTRRGVASVAGLRVSGRKVIWHGAAQSLRAEPCRLVTAIARRIR